MRGKKTSLRTIYGDAVVDKVKEQPIKVMGEKYYPTTGYELEPDKQPFCIIGAANFMAYQTYLDFLNRFMYIRSYPSPYDAYRQAGLILGRELTTTEKKFIHAMIYEWDERSREPEKLQAFAQEVLA